MEMNDFGMVPDDIDMDFAPPEEMPEETNQVPHNREAEEAVLGAVLINPEKYFDVSEIINEKDFYIVQIISYSLGYVKRPLEIAFFLIIFS